jgi:hypothetical protein
MNLFEMFEQGPPKPTLIDALRDFLPIAITHLKLDHIPKIKLVESLDDTTFGRYVNDEQIIYVVVDNRNPVDILRTLAHEMVHYTQGQENQLTSASGNTGSPIEDEANAEAGVIMRLFNQKFPNYLTTDSVVLPESKQRLDAKCWKGYKKQGTKMKGDTRVNNCVPIEESYDGDEFFEAYGELWYNEDEQLDEAEYHGHKVPLGKPMQGDVKKFKVYVKDPSTGNIKKVNFGDPNMRIKKSNPARRKSFRARHNCANPGPRTKARYWSCRKW